MAKARITRSSVDKLEYPGRQAEYFDTKLTGFGVRVNAGSRSYFVQCRVKDQFAASGKPLEIKETIGRCDRMDFDTALVRAKAIIEDAASGISPADRKNEESARLENIARDAALDAQKEITVEEVLVSYVETKKRLKESSADLYREELERYCPEWMTLPIRSITGKMILEKHTEIGKRSPSRADAVMRTVRALCNHVIRTSPEVMEHNPVNMLSAAGGWYNVPRRKTYLRPYDLPKWWADVHHIRNDTARDLILLLLFNGPRIEETTCLTWGDIASDNRSGVFRETKTGDPLEVPFPLHITHMLEERRKYYDKGPESFVFPSYGTTGHITSVRKSLQVVGDRCGITLTHHDLRRTFITYCEELDIGLYTRKRLTNHALPGRDVTEGYTQVSMERMRRAIDQVARYILRKADTIPPRLPEPQP